jgi:hypothetical protein
LFHPVGVAVGYQGHKVRYFTAAELVETLYRALADNSVGKMIDTLLQVMTAAGPLPQPQAVAPPNTAACPHRMTVRPHAPSGTNRVHDDHGAHEACPAGG